MSSFWFILKQQWTIEEISIFSNSSHLEWRAGLSDTILKGTTQGSFQQSLDEIGSVVSEKIFFKFHPPFFLFLVWRPSWLEIGITGNNFGRRPSKDHSIKVWLQLAQWFLRRNFLCEFPKGSYVKLSSAVGAILVQGPMFHPSFFYLHNRSKSAKVQSS